MNHKEKKKEKYNNNMIERNMYLHIEKKYMYR